MEEGLSVLLNPSCGHHFPLGLQVMGNHNGEIEDLVIQDHSNRVFIETSSVETPTAVLAIYKLISYANNSRGAKLSLEELGMDPCLYGSEVDEVHEGRRW